MSVGQRVAGVTAGASTAGAADARSVLWAVLVGQRRLIAGATVLMMLWQGCESLVPVVIGAIIDDAIIAQDGAAMGAWLAALGGLFLVLSLSFRFGSRLTYRAAQRSGHEARVSVASAVLDPLAVPDPARRIGATVSVAGTDAERVGLFSYAVPRTLGSLVSVVVTAVVVLRIDIVLGLVVLIGAPVLLALIHLLGAPLRERSEAEQAGAADTAAVASDFVQGLRVLRGIGGEGVAARRYAVVSRRSLAATLRAARSQAGYDGVILLLTMIFLAAIALVAGRFAAENRIEVGQLVAAVGLAQFLIGPLQQLTNTGAVLARARASADRVASVLNTPRYGVTAATVDMPAGASVRITTLDLDVPGGTTLGVAADSDDAAALVAALADPRAATVVEIDGTDVGALGVDAEADALLVAAHDAHLFAESLLDNVRAGRPDNARVQQAVRAADADEVARTLPEGAATLLAERGQSLSGGQRQRVALARAIAVDPLVLVLHDPTTAVDGATESRVAEGMARARRGRTTVLVTTSPTLLASCDVVVHVEHGEVRARGTHPDLLERDPDYRQLVLA